METWELHMWGLKATWLLFTFAFGACVGSLTNVLVYRLPLGLSVVRPASRCPKCQTKLTWRENIPILGWLLLGGKCRFCRQPISVEYPLVEAAAATLFAGLYALWYMVPPGTVVLGVDLGAVRPEWADPYSSAEQTWPIFLVLLALVGSLLGMTLVDAKTFTIPLVLTWVPAVAGLALHVGNAAWIEYFGSGRLLRTAPGEAWAIPTPVEVLPGGALAGGWPVILAAIGGVIGLIIGNVLLATGLIRRSFADYGEWEQSVAPQTPAVEPAAPVEVGVTEASPAEAGSGERIATDEVHAAPSNAASPADVWIQYPHARREMFKELAFLAPCGVLAMAGWYLGQSWPETTPPLWVGVLGGVLVGYLVGGGVVWATRILGSVGFGKEAMGLGDVHMMAAVGACLGWIDATLAFFGAAFVGLAWAVLGRVVSGGMKRAMPYGPFLAVSTVLIVLLKPLVELGLSELLRRPINLP